MAIKSRVIPIISQQLKKRMKAHGLTISKLAHIAGVSVGSVHKILQNDPDINITVQVIEKIAEALDTPLESFLTHHGESFTKFRTRLIEWSDILTLPDVSKEELIAVHKAVSPDAFAVTWTGHSMAPNFPKGTILVIEPGADIYDGCFAILNIDNNAVFKQIVFDPPHMYCQSIKTGLAKAREVEKSHVVGVLVEAIALFE